MWGTVLGKPATPVRLALLALSLVKSWVKCHKQSRGAGFPQLTQGTALVSPSLSGSGTKVTLTAV